jgi:hypothetical protein
MQVFLAAVIGLGLAFLLWRQWRVAERKRLQRPMQLFATVQGLFDSPSIEASDAAGVWKLTGQYKGQIFQLKAIVDTLATRKLPSLWLMVTLPETQSVKATLDLMMRPTGPSTFSNFDFLPHTVKTPTGFPEHAVLRTDDPKKCPSAELLRPHLDLFETRAGKELLISARGLRIVVLVAEVDRLRYGVFREANFGDTVIDKDLVSECLETLLALKATLKS